MFRAFSAFVIFSYLLQQHRTSPESPLHEHSPVLPSMRSSIAAAHPTPVSTEIAAAGQFRAQAPQAMHRSDAFIRAVVLPSDVSSSNTACGQTSLHSPHPTQASRLRRRDSPFRG